MTKHRYRTSQSGGKLIMKHSSMLQGLKELLLDIAGWSEVKTVRAGVITNKRSTSGRQLTIRVQTSPQEWMVKCVASRTGQFQDVFITSDVPEKVIARIRTQEWGQ